MTPSGAAPGDSPDFRALVQRHGGAVYNLARSFASDSDHVQDLVQEIWIRVYERRAQYRGRSELGWVLAIARSVCVDQRRRERRRSDWVRRFAPTLPGEGVGDAEGVLLDGLSNQGIAEAAFQALADLPDRQREAIVLRVVEGLDPSEAAERMGCEKATIRSLIRQGLMRIRRNLESES